MPPYKSESPRSGSPVPGPSTDAQSSGSPSCSKTPEINHDISVDDDLGPRARKGKLPSVTESSAIKDDVEGRVISTSNGQFYENSIVWKNIILFVFLHSSLLYCLYALLVDWPWRTLFFSTILGIGSGLGVTVGAHRLWSHRAYKAKLPLRLFLAMMQTVAGQNDIYEWCRDHRVHHKFSETDADPHNAKRGFFFSHMGWLCVRKHPDVMNKGSTVDLSDLLEDPVVYYQKKFYLPLAAMFSFVIPTIIPWYFWNEKFLTAYMMAAMARYCVSLHITWLVNSAAHIWGNRPYDINIGARENKFVSFGSMGEGWHNYHHTFPWDYSTSEFGYRLNFSTFFIDTMAWLGLAYDRKAAPKSLIEARKKNTGDHSLDDHDHEEVPDPYTDDLLHALHSD